MQSRCKADNLGEQIQRGVNCCTQSKSLVAGKPNGGSGLATTQEEKSLVMQSNPRRQSDEFEFEPLVEQLLRENERLKRQIDELERLASRDTLTPLFNRRHFQETLERWSWRAHRRGGDYGLIIIDVDSLKTVNDTMGHGAGDKVLIAIADVMLKTMRRSDIVARLGGDEFGILIDAATPDVVAAMAELLRSDVAKLKIEFGNCLINPTISLGHGMLDPSKSAEENMAIVDRHMYLEKHASRRDAGQGALTGALPVSYRQDNIGHQPHFRLQNHRLSACPSGFQDR